MEEKSKKQIFLEAKTENDALSIATFFLHLGFIYEEKWATAITCKANIIHDG